MHVFFHIPKTAGTSIMNVLRRTFDMRLVFHAGKKSETVALHAMDRQTRFSYEAVEAHQPYIDLKKLFGPDPTYFSVVRQPEERIISLWRHVARDTN